MSILYRAVACGDCELDTTEVERWLAERAEVAYSGGSHPALPGGPWSFGVKALNDGCASVVLRAQSADRSRLHQVAFVLTGTEQWVELIVRAPHAAAGDAGFLAAVPPDIHSFVSEVSALITTSAQTAAQLAGEVLEYPASGNVVGWAHQTHVPMVLLPDDDRRRSDASAAALLERVAGMAVVVRCDPEDASDVLREFGLDSPTPAGSMISVAFKRGQPVLDAVPSFVALHQRDAAIRRLHRSCLNGACAIELPPPVTASLGACEALDSSGGDETLWESAALDLDHENRELRAQVGDLGYQLDVMILDQEEVELDLDQAQREVRYLRKRLVELGDFGFGGDPIEEEFVPVERCEQAVARAREMGHLWIGDTSAAVRQLDQADKSGVWAKKALRAFTVLNDYAESKSAGAFVGNFLSFCADPAIGPGLPGTWVALNESESTGQRALTRDQRTFVVPATVATVGTVFMEAHIKLSNSDSLAPRIHFYDDTGGQSGKVLVGYFGPHLETGG